MTPEIQILDGAEGPELAIVDGPGVARAIVWPGIGARSRSLHRISLEGGAATVRLSHPSDAVYYVVEGDGSVADESAGEDHALRAGAMFHIDAGTAYRVRAGVDGLQLLGGPAPADDALYESVGGAAA
jgi:mannose-6-phosphate isomerase-like protein (cupin superfamily)